MNDATWWESNGTRFVEDGHLLRVLLASYSELRVDDLYCRECAHVCENLDLCCAHCPSHNAQPQLGELVRFTRQEIDAVSRPAGPPPTPWPSVPMFVLPTADTHDVDEDQSFDLGGGG